VSPRRRRPARRRPARAVDVGRGGSWVDSPITTRRGVLLDCMRES
jgi:hypothetical protein